VRADGLRGAGSREVRVRDIEGGLGCVVQHPGLAVAGEDISLDADDGRDVGMPVGVVEFVLGIEDRDGAGFAAVACVVAALGRAERGGGDGDFRDFLMQSRLVILELDDQGDSDLRGDLEMFF
jgi:hypothetical protein